MASPVSAHGPARGRNAGGLTVVSWNVENLAVYLGNPRPARAGAPPPALESVVAEFGRPDVLCLQETRIRPQDGPLIASARAALPGYECHMAINRDPVNARFRGGRAYGVATYLRNDLQASHSTLPWDLEGRVLVTQLAAEQLAIVNVYAVNGTGKPHFDHELGRIDGDRHAFKRNFNQRLMEACAELQAQGLSLVLIGDWNISRAAVDTFPRLRTEPPHALARRLFNDAFIPGLRVIDVFRHLHPTSREYTWFARASGSGRLDAARVDFALLSENLLPRLKSADILADKSMRFASDHAPLRVVLGACPKSG